MKVPAVGIRKIEQVDNFSFAVEWTDGSFKRYRLSDLQKECPCSHCVDESTGDRTAKAGAVKEDVRGRRVYSVGRYALRIEFTSGCSTGIYSYEFLHSRGSIE